MIESGDIDLEKFIYECAIEYKPNRKVIEIMPFPQESKSRNKLEYHKERLEKAKNRLSEFLEIDIERYEQKAKEDYEESLILYNKRMELISTKINKILKMRDKIQEWNPPSENHEGLKQWILNNLESLYSTTKQEYAIPTLLSGREWADRELEYIQNDIAYHQYQYDSEKPLHDLDKEWFESLFLSFGSLKV